MQSLEQKKIADWSAKMSRIEQAGRKKDEMNKDFANQAKEALDAKMGNYEEKREAIMTDLKEKLKVRETNLNGIYEINQSINFLLCLESIPRNREDSSHSGATEATRTHGNR